MPVPVAGGVGGGSVHEKGGHQPTPARWVCIRGWSAFRSTGEWLPSMREAIGENVRVDLVTVLDFVASAAAAALHVGRVVETLGAVNEDNLAVHFQALQLRGAAVFEPDGFDIVNRFEQGVVHRDFLQLFVGENLLEFPTEGAVPVRGRTAR